MEKDGKIPVYSSISDNNGIIGYTHISPTYMISEETPFYVVFGDHTRSFNIANTDFCVMDNVKVLKPLRSHTLKELIFVISSWKNGVVDKGYSRHWSIAKEVRIQLPTKNGEVDFEFMGDFVAELEAQRVAELEAYLTVTGLNDYVLTEEEEKAIQDYLTVNWKEYSMGELFERVSTKKLPYKAKDLPKEPCGESILPALTSSFMNQGLNYYVPKDEATVLKNVISIPSNSDVYRAYFQSRDFTVLSDAYAIDWIYEDKELNPEQYLFTVPCINKVTDLPIYSYKNKLGGWNVVKKKKIELPTVDGNVDYDYMETLTKAIQKLVIKDVVDYIDKKIQVIKKVILR